MNNNATRQIATLIYPNANSIDISGPLQVFDTANRLLQEHHKTSETYYTTQIIGPTPHPIAVSAGLNLVPAQDISVIPKTLDTLFIAGGMGADAAANNTDISRWIKNSASNVRRLASICSGALILAATGLLDRRRATTHWYYADQLSAQHPLIKIDIDAIFTQDDNIYCSAGVTAGIDLALALVEEDWGHTLALTVARHLVVFLKRPGGQSQFSHLLAAQAAPQTPIAETQQWIMQNLQQNLSIETLAAKAALSPRHFSRTFKKVSGITPSQFISRARLDRARHLLETSDLALEAIAKQCGIGHGETLRRLFWQYFHTSPKTYRERFRTEINTS